MNTISVFAKIEIPFIIAIYVGGSMLSDAMPHLWAKGKRIWIKIQSFCSAKTIKSENKKTTIQLALPVYKQETQLQVKNADNQGNGNCDETTDSDSLEESSSVITVLSDEIINYTYGSFENVMTKEQIEKFLDNFRNLNNGGPYEVIENKKLKDVLEFDLVHFAWNICRRIHDPKVCPLIFTIATAELIKASFPITLINYDVKTLKSRLRDSYPTTKFKLPIVELHQPLEPYHLGKSDDTNCIEIK